MRRIAVLMTGALMCASLLRAQIADEVYRSDRRIDTAEVGQLRVELDNLSFFKNNEFAGGFQPGYTLPGIWLQPKLVYAPLKRVKLEVGAHLLRYWGATNYPCYAYHDIATWSGKQYQKAFHALPWLRAQVDFSERFSLVLGDIYGAANHQLVEPLFNQEMNMMADPEAGLQLLYRSPHFEGDMWVNWQSFIFREDTHQEAFIVGLSSKFKFNPEEAPVHAYVPFQLMAQHRGGEIDTIHVNSVQTLVNGAVGVGATWNANGRWVRRVGVEADALLSWQQSGSLWPFDKGWGAYVRLFADVRRLRIKAGYWQCDKFVSLLGSPFFNAISMQDEGTVFHSPKMVLAGLEYSYPLGKAFAVGVDVDLYCHMKGTKTAADGLLSDKKSATSFSTGVYLRLNPSFLVKDFRK